MGNLYHIILFIFVSTTISLSQNTEICDNGIDDDADGLIDLNDVDDCFCKTFEPISLIPNPSFEDLICCPYELSLISCADVWIQASEPTTDLIHTCGWGGELEFPPPIPFPDGNGIVGFRDGAFSQSSGFYPNWKEYAGACLLSPLQKDTTYRFEFDLGFTIAGGSPPINITIFGASTCDILPFGVNDDEFGCPTNDPGWIKLGSKFVSGGAGNKWVKTNIIITPSQEIAAIAIGPSCSVRSEEDREKANTYYFLDNLTLSNINQFQLEISEKSDPCTADFRLAVQKGDNFAYQWYLNGVALQNEDKSQLSQNFGVGNYQVRITADGICKLSGIYEYRRPAVRSKVKEIICSEDEFKFGDRFLTRSGTYLDTFVSVNECDSIVKMELKVLGEHVDTIVSSIVQGDVYEIGDDRFSEKGEYLITLESSLGCDSLVLLQLSILAVYVPNVFSPNDDGFNDTFSLLGAQNFFTVLELRIYDRWGDRVYQGKEWDGTIKGELSAQGAYIYKATVLFKNGTKKNLIGSFTLIR